jgi:hypothetical protein
MAKKANLPQGGSNRGPRSNKKNKGKGGSSPKRSLVVERLPEDPAGAAAFDALVDRDYSREEDHVVSAGESVGEAGCRAPPAVPAAWDDDDDEPQAEEPEPSAVHHHQQSQQPQQLTAGVLSPAAQQQQAAAARFFVTSPSSDANTEEFMAYFDRDDESPVVAPEPAPAPEPTPAPAPARAPAAAVAVSPEAAEVVVAASDVAQLRAQLAQVQVWTLSPASLSGHALSHTNIPATCHLSVRVCHLSFSCVHESRSLARSLSFRAVRLP